MKRILSLLLAAATIVSCAFAQSPVISLTPGAAPATAAPAALYIKGELLIRFDSRTQKDGDKPRAGVTDKYKLKVNVANSIGFEGTIEHLPFVKNKVTSNQIGMLTHAIECYVIRPGLAVPVLDFATYDPAKPQNARNIGRLYGSVPIDEKNVYRFEDGNLRIGIFGANGTNGFESKVKGLALGKPPAGSSWSLDSARKKAAITLSRMVGDAVVKLPPITNYDEMTFQGHSLSAGPILTYPETNVAGRMIYNYDRTSWLFDGITVNYSMDGRMMADRLSGEVRWVERPISGGTRDGEYTFNLRFNEPPVTEAAAFAAPANEDAFFATTTTLPSLTGTMRYKDTIIPGTTVPSLSVITIDLSGSQLTKQQLVYITKLLLMSCVVPFNSE